MEGEGGARDDGSADHAADIERDGQNGGVRLLERARVVSRKPCAHIDERSGPNVTNDRAADRNDLVHYASRHRDVEREVSARGPSSMEKAGDVEIAVLYAYLAEVRDKPAVARNGEVLLVVVTRVLVAHDRLVAINYEIARHFNTSWAIFDICYHSFHIYITSPSLNRLLLPTRQGSIVASYLWLIKQLCKF